MVDFLFGWPGKLAAWIAEQVAQPILRSFWAMVGAMLGALIGLLLGAALVYCWALHADGVVPWVVAILGLPVCFVVGAVIGRVIDFVLDRGRSARREQRELRDKTRSRSDRRERSPEEEASLEEALAADAQSPTTMEDTGIAEQSRPRPRRKDSFFETEAQSEPGDDNADAARSRRRRRPQAAGTGMPLVSLGLIFGGFLCLGGFGLLGTAGFVWYVVQDRQGRKVPDEPKVVVENKPNKDKNKVNPPVDPPIKQPPVIDPPIKQPPPPVQDLGPAIAAMRMGKFVAPLKAAGPTTYLLVSSSPGDYIGQGKTYSYPNVQMTVKPNFRGLSVQVDEWRMNFAAPGKQPLNLGEYRNAKRFPFNDNSPGLDFSGMGRGSNQLSGEFMVWQLENDGVNITRLAIDFVQRSENNGPPLYGVLRYNSSWR